MVRAREHSPAYPAIQLPSWWQTSLFQTNQEQGAHLFVCQHGLWGSTDDVAFLEQYLRHNGWLTLNARRNSARCTFDGADVCGDRLAAEVEAEVARLRLCGTRVTHISFAGYSFGGLICRYAVGKLLAAGLFDRITPVNFVSIASPHLGCWESPASMTHLAYNSILPWTLSRTGRQLMLADRWLEAEVPSEGEAMLEQNPRAESDHEWPSPKLPEPEDSDARAAPVVRLTASASTDDLAPKASTASGSVPTQPFQPSQPSLPLLAAMARPGYAFHVGLAAFQKRLLLADIYMDKTVPYSTAAITACNPYVDGGEGYGADGSDGDPWVAVPLPISSSYPCIVAPHRIRVEPEPHGGGLGRRSEVAVAKAMGADQASGRYSDSGSNLSRLKRSNSAPQPHFLTRAVAAAGFCAGKGRVNGSEDSSGGGSSTERSASPAPRGGAWRRPYPERPRAGAGKALYGSASSRSLLHGGDGSDGGGPYSLSRLASVSSGDMGASSGDSGSGSLSSRARLGIFFMLLPLLLALWLATVMWLGAIALHHYAVLLTVRPDRSWDVRVWGHTVRRSRSSGGHRGSSGGSSSGGASSSLSLPRDVPAGPTAQDTDWASAEAAVTPHSDESDEEPGFEANDNTKAEWPFHRQSTASRASGSTGGSSATIGSTVADATWGCGDGHDSPPVELVMTLTRPFAHGVCGMGDRAPCAAEPRPQLCSAGLDDEEEVGGACRRAACEPGPHAMEQDRSQGSASAATAPVASGGDDAAGAAGAEAWQGGTNGAPSCSSAQEPQAMAAATVRDAVRRIVCSVVAKAQPGDVPGCAADAMSSGSEFVSHGEEALCANKGPGSEVAELVRDVVRRILSGIVAADAATARADTEDRLQPLAAPEGLARNAGTEACSAPAPGASGRAKGRLPLQLTHSNGRPPRPPRPVACFRGNGGSVVSAAGVSQTPEDPLPAVAQASSGASRDAPSQQRRQGPRLSFQQQLLAEMIENLNMLEWQKVDVDTRHYHAHAAIVVRSAARFRASHMHILEYAVRQLKL